MLDSSKKTLYEKSFTITVKAKPHTHTMVKHSAVAATCGAEGNIEYYTCSGCNKYFKNSNGTAEITKAQTVTSALGHSWGEWRITKEATEKATGERQRVCQRNSSHVEKQTLPVKSHTHTMEKHSAVSATCTTEGNIEYYTCSGCGKYFKDVNGKTEITQSQTVTPALGHLWGEWKVTKEQTGNKSGEKKRVCQRNSAHEERVFFNSVSVHSHTLEKHSAAEPTCTTGGNIEYYTCSGCGKYFKDENAMTELATAEISFGLSTMPLGHSWGEWQVIKEATETESGERQRVCQRDDEHVEKQVIPAKQHTLEIRVRT